jgi:hypothetical protein
VTGLLLQLLFLAGFPALLAAGSTWLSWNSLLRPWRYLLVCCIALYFLYVAVVAALGPKTGGYILSASVAGEPSEPTPAFLFLEPYALALAAFSAAALPLVWFLLRKFKKERERERPRTGEV